MPLFRSVGPRGALLVAALLSPTGSAPGREGPPVRPPDQDYLAFVASEGNDQIALVRFGSRGARVERQRRIGSNPAELLGPHGLAVSPDGRFYYVTTAHGTPNGALWKFSTETDAQLGRVELGHFPATVQVSPDSREVWVVNFNLYGAMQPSSVSVVSGDAMAEVRRISTCVMPHGSRLSPDGSHHYSACMMDDLLVEIDRATMTVSRHFLLTRGREMGMEGPPGAGMAMAPSGTGNGAASDITCSPTWAQPSADGRTVWVACNKSADIAEIDLGTWTLRRRIAAGDGIYNLAASRDGRLLVGTNKRGRSVSVIDAASGAELARIPTTRRVPSGLVLTPDSRYALVTLEGVGSEPGTVDVIDLEALVRVASVDVGQQAGGIDFWKTAAPE